LERFPDIHYTADWVESRAIFLYGRERKILKALPGIRESDIDPLSETCHVAEL
jgi:hypothetical protein